MTISIHLSEEAERRLIARAAAAGQDLESFVNQVLAEELSNETSHLSQAVQPEDFSQRLRKLIADHGVRCGSFDDSRDSIYAGCGQ